MKDIGNRIKLLEKDDLFIRMETAMKVCGRMMFHRAKAPIDSMSRVQFMTDCGRTTCKMVTGKRYGQITLSSKEYMNLG